MGSVRLEVGAYLIKEGLGEIFLEGTGIYTCSEYPGGQVCRNFTYK